MATTIRTQKSHFRYELWAEVDGGPDRLVGTFCRPREALKKGLGVEAPTYIRSQRMCLLKEAYQTEVYFSRR